MDSEANRGGTPPISAQNRTAQRLTNSNNGDISSEPTISSTTPLVGRRENGELQFPTPTNQVTTNEPSSLISRTTLLSDVIIDTTNANVPSTVATDSTRSNANNPSAAPLAPTAGANANGRAYANEIVNTNANISNDVHVAPPTAPVPRRRGHRARSNVWKLLTSDEDPHKIITSTCVHCEASVPHHRKSEKARAHLKRCAAFLQYIATLDDATQRPDWLEDSSSKSSELELQEEEERRGSSYHPPPPLYTGSSSSSAKRAKISTMVQPLGAAQAAHEAHDLDKIRASLAMYIYLSGVPFAHGTNKHLLRAFQFCLPPPATHHQLGPTFQQLGGVLLDQAVASMRTQRIQKLLSQQKTNKTMTLCLNSWMTQAKDTSLYVMVAGHANCTMFVDEVVHPVRTNGQEEDEAVELIFAQLAKALAFCEIEIQGIVADNSPIHRLVGAKMKLLYPHKFFHGCVAHGLHLFVEQLFGSIDETEPMRAEQPPPFQELRQLVVDCRAIVALVTSRTGPLTKADAETAARSPNPPLQLQFPVHGDWRNLKRGLQSVFDALPELTRIATATTAAAKEEDRRLLKLLTVENALSFRHLLLKALALLEPLDLLIQIVHNDSQIPISDVFFWFAKQLPVSWSNCVIAEGLCGREASFLLSLNQIRFNAMYGDGHGMAYLLDPRYIGEGLSRDVRKNIEQLIVGWPGSLESLGSSGSVEMQQQLTEFVVVATHEKTTYSSGFEALATQKKSVLQFWQGADGAKWPLLQILAVNLFQLPASTAPHVAKVLAIPLRMPMPSTSGNEEHADQENHGYSVETAKKIVFLQRNQALLDEEEEEEEDQDDGTAHRA